MKAFAKFHPVTLFAYFAVILLFSMFIRNPVTVCLSLLGGAAFCSTLTNKREKLDDIKFYIPLTVLIAITNPLISHNGKTPLFFLNGNAFTLESIYYGVFIALMIIAVLMWSKSYSRIVTSDKFLYLFGRFAPKTALILSVALRYVPMMKAQAKKIKDAQKTLGLYSKGSYADNVVSTVKVYSALIGWSLENAVETGKNMKARGWGHGKRTSFSSFRFRAADAVVLVLLAVFSAAMLISLRTGRLAFSFYPEPTALPADPVSVFAYVCFALLSFIPFFIESEENIRWNCLRSKT